MKKETFEYKNQSLKPIMIAYYKYYKDEINKFSTLVVCDSMWSDSSYSKKLKTKSHNVGTQKSH